jgi:hypothetical protein
MMATSWSRGHLNHWSAVFIALGTGGELGLSLAKQGEIGAKCVSQE